MKLFRTLALVGAGLLVRKWAAHRKSTPQVSARPHGIDVETRPMAYPIAASTPEAPGLGPTQRPVLP